MLEGADAAAITVALSELVDAARASARWPACARSSWNRAARPRGKRGVAILWDPNDAYVGRVLQTMAGSGARMRLPPLPAWGVNHGCVLAPVVAGDETLGYLAILESDTSDASNDDVSRTRSCWPHSTPPASTPSP